MTTSPCADGAPFNTLFAFLVAKPINLNDKQVFKLGETMIPIPHAVIRLGEEHRLLIATHLAGLDADDRVARFRARINPTAVEAYAQGLDLSRDRIFGLIDQNMLYALAEICPRPEGGVELVLSVERGWRRKGAATKLMEAAIAICERHGLSPIHLNFEAVSLAMLRLARKFSFEITYAGTAVHAVRDRTACAPPATAPVGCQV